MEGIRDGAALCPGLLWALDREGLIEALLGGELGVSLRVVPEIGVARPVAELPEHDARLEAPAGGGVAGFELERESFDEGRAVREVPPALGRVLDGFV